ncbi:MAG TPA: hypothetical protein VM537_19250 [Anaerolineae bacterium]|nr:hypothetical protein [Anaerolineae bacterium]
MANIPDPQTVAPFRQTADIRTLRDLLMYMVCASNGELSPCWRWEVALFFYTDKSAVYTPHADDYLNKAIEYYRCSLQGTENLLRTARNHPLMHGAFLLKSATRADNGKKFMVEAMIMAGASDKEISKHLTFPLGSATINMYRRVFFDVDFSRSRLDILDAIFGPRMVGSDGKSDMDYTWKLIGYKYGMEKLVPFLEHIHGFSELDPEIKAFLTSQLDARGIRAAFESSHRLRNMYQASSLPLFERVMLSRDISSDSKAVLSSEHLAWNSGITGICESIEAVTKSRELIADRTYEMAENRREHHVKLDEAIMDKMNAGRKHTELAPAEAELSHDASIKP